MTTTSHSALRRLALRACPRRERPWLAALFAETSAIESPGSRLAWHLGAIGLLVRANARQSFTELALHSLLAMLTALVGSLLLASPSLLGFEVLNLEDDWFLVAATLFGTLLPAAIALSLLDSRHSDAPKEHSGILP